MQEIAQNSFNEGISKDVSALLQKNSTAIHIENITLFTKENQNYVLTNIRGNKYEFALPLNYHVVASKTYNDVCYLLLAETINGVSTGKGQIGSFPSPDFNAGSNGNMLNRYSPFHNYGGDFNQYPLKNGPFISSNFKFPIDKNVDIVLQRAYDGTVNVIFTDGVNPIRIINSAFRVNDKKTFTIVERQSGNQDNKYTFDNFESTINLTLTTQTIAKINFEGVFTGGKVKSGNYIYYFKYSTNDGNETSFFGESSIVQISVGDGVYNIRGGKGDGEDTDKQVRFKLTQLDINYDFLVVYFSHATGENSTVNSLYKINSRIRIQNGEANFTHTGFETVLLQDSSLFQDIYGSIDTADAITEIQGYLIAGGIKQKNIDFSPFKSLAREIKLTSVTKEMEAGLGDMSLYFSRKISSEPVKDFYNLGYYNPMNVYNNLGYWGAEAYPFGFRLILNNGELTDVYPVLGCDNLSGMFNENDYSFYNFDQIDELNQGIGTVNTFNTKGIYRFPKRDNSFYNAQTDTVKINGIKFHIPVISDAVKKIAKGIVFVRGERKKNVIMQGIITDVFKVPLDDRYNFLDKKHPDRRLNLYNTYDTAYKLVPAPGFKLESSYLTRFENTVNGKFGVHYVHMSHQYASGKYVQGGGWQDSFAFFSGDYFINQEKAISLFASNDFKIQSISDIDFLHDIQTARADSYLLSDVNKENIFDHFSLLRSVNYKTTGYGELNVKSTYVLGGYNEPIGQNKFSSACYFLDQESTQANVAAFPLSYDDYIGLHLTDPSVRFTIGSTNGINGRCRMLASNFGRVEKMAMLVNVYPQGGLWNNEALRQNWLDISTVRYTPISQRMDWDELESSLDQSRAITLFKGDCYTVPVYRRLYMNRFGEDETVSDNINEDNRKKAHIGPTIAWVSENDSNLALRVPVYENSNSNEPNTFSPFGKTLQPSFNKIADNSWRKTRQFESKGFNYGYNKNIGDNFGITVDYNRPFTENDWYSRLVNSNRHIPNAFVNGYRQIGYDYQNYDPSKGRITKVVPFGNDLLMIQEDGISVIPVNQRLESASDNAGPVFIQSNQVLSPYQGYKSHFLGSQHPDSILLTENAVYGYDAKRFTWWKIALSGELSSISDMSIGSYLRKYTKRFVSNKFNKAKINIVSGWDIKNREVFLSFYDLDSDNKFTVAYSEYVNVITHFNSYNAFNFFNLENSVYSIPLKNKSKVYVHEFDGQKRLLIYDEPRKGILRFAVNKQHEANKVFDFIEIVSNNVLADKIIYWTQGASSIQDVVYDPENIFLSNAKYREEKAVIHIPRTGWVTDRSVTEYLEQNEDNAEAQIFEGSRIRGKVLVVEIQYSTDKLLEISSVLTYFRKSLR